ncbi:hypothetical protein [Jannaschia pagri]|nr:hypothetical protein [Jannaschia sp. AI_62]
MSIEDRKQLYRALRAVADLSNIHIEVLIIRAVGQDIVFGTDYISNFRRGNIAQARARKIHSWLSQNHWADVHEVVPDLFPAPEAGPWKRLIEERAQATGLKIQRLDQFGIVQRVRDSAEEITSLQLGTPFCFEIDAPRSGSAIMFQEHKGYWYPLPLSKDGTGLRCMVGAGINVVPHSGDSKPISLTENDDTGRHQFVCLVIDEEIKLASLKTIEKAVPQLGGPIAPALLNSLASEIKSRSLERFALFRVAVRFVA